MALVLLSLLIAVIYVDAGLIDDAGMDGPLLFLDCRLPNLLPLLLRVPLLLLFFFLPLLPRFRFLPVLDQAVPAAAALGLGPGWPPIETRFPVYVAALPIVCQTISRTELKNLETNSSSSLSQSSSRHS